MDNTAHCLHCDTHSDTTRELRGRTPGMGFSGLEAGCLYISTPLSQECQILLLYYRDSIYIGQKAGFKGK